VEETEDPESSIRDIEDLAEDAIEPATEHAIEVITELTAEEVTEDTPQLESEPSVVQQVQDDRENQTEVTKIAEKPSSVIEEPIPAPENNENRVNAEKEELEEISEKATPPTVDSSPLPEQDKEEVAEMLQEEEPRETMRDIPSVVLDSNSALEENHDSEVQNQEEKINKVVGPSSMADSAQEVGEIPISEDQKEDPKDIVEETSSKAESDPILEESSPAIEEPAPAEEIKEPEFKTIVVTEEPSSLKEEESTSTQVEDETVDEGSTKDDQPKDAPSVADESHNAEDVAQTEEASISDLVLTDDIPKEVELPAGIESVVSEFHPDTTESSTPLIEPPLAAVEAEQSPEAKDIIPARVEETTPASDDFEPISAAEDITPAPLEETPRDLVVEESAPVVEKLDAAPIDADSIPCDPPVDEPSSPPEDAQISDPVADVTVEKVSPIEAVKSTTPPPASLGEKKRRHRSSRHSSHHGQSSSRDKEKPRSSDKDNGREREKIEKDIKPTSSRHSKPPSSSPPKDLPSQGISEGSPRLHHHRKRRDSEASLRASFVPTLSGSPSKPKRHDSGFSIGSNGNGGHGHRKIRTPDEQAAHDLRKEARRKAREDEKYASVGLGISDPVVLEDPIVAGDVTVPKEVKERRRRRRSGTLSSHSYRSVPDELINESPIRNSPAKEATTREKEKPSLQKILDLKGESSMGRPENLRHSSSHRRSYHRTPEEKAAHEMRKAERLAQKEKERAEMPVVEEVRDKTAPTTGTADKDEERRKRHEERRRRRGLLDEAGSVGSKTKKDRERNKGEKDKESKPKGGIFSRFLSAVGVS